jgi:hypothetical protein
MPMVVPAAASWACHAARGGTVLLAHVLFIVTKVSAQSIGNVVRATRHKTAQPAMHKTNVMRPPEGLWFGRPLC